MPDDGTPLEERFPRPSVVGVLNVTPDSFSDGGEFMRPADAIAHGRRLFDEGAALVDVGGESTRPGARGVPAGEEIARVEPVLEGLAGVPVSIDTSKAAVARRALELGAVLVNDVTALRGDPDLSGLVADAGAYLCLMHMQGEPRTMQEAPRYDDVVSEVAAFLEERLGFAVAQGISEDRVCLDPGIGFGKTPDQNLELVRRLDRIVAIGRPVLVGFSRKSTLGKILGDAGASPGTTPASLGAAVAAFERGASLLRVHDVRETVEAIRVAAAVERGDGERVIIELQGLVVFGRHGYLEEERRVGQRFFVDLWAELDQRSTVSDDLEESIDYRRLAELVKEVFAGPSRLLLEGLAGAVADGVMERFQPVRSVRVRVRKPDVVLDPTVDHAAVIVERERA